MKKLRFTSLILIVSLFIALESRATDKEQWFCTDDQAMKTGNTFVICGVGTYSTEGDARTKALNNAMNEFMTICELSSDCKGHKITVEPKRSSCFENTKKYHTTFEQFTCHRMFLFTVQ
jgi:hypothetical protein